MIKKCAKCGKEKDVSEFHANKRNSDGLHSYCKECNAKKAKDFNKTDKGLVNVKKAQKKQFESGYFKFGKGAIANMSASAQERGIEFDLTLEDLSAWWKNTPDVCCYCGCSTHQYKKIRDVIVNYNGDNWEIEKFKKFYQKDMYVKTNELTIDRKDSSKGYTIKNITKACWICNSLKSNFFSEKEMQIVGKLVIDNLKKEIEKEND